MKRILFSFVVLSLLVIPPSVLGSDLDDLKTAEEKFVQAFNSLNANAVAQMTQPGLTVFDTDSPFPSVYQDRDAVKDSMQNWFSGLESLDIVVIDPQYNIVGNTGIMVGYETLTSKPRGGPSTTAYYRISITFVKSGGKWLALNIHLSYFPSGKP